MGQVPQALPAQGRSVVESAAELLLADDLVGTRAALGSLTAGPSVSDPEVLHLLGLVEAREQRLDRAVAYLERAVALRPRNRAWLRNLGLLYMALKNWSGACAVLRQATELNPEDAEVFRALGKAEVGRRHYEGALAAFERAYSLGGDEQGTALEIAATLADLRRYPAAAEVLEAVVESYPDYAAAHALLADVYQQSGHPESIRKHREEVYRLRPDDADAQARLAAACWDNGDLPRSLELTRALVVSGKATAAIQSFYATSLLNDGGQTAASIRSAHERGAKALTLHVRRFTQWPNHPAARRPLRVGYCGGDLYQNPSYHFLIPLFRHHDRERFKVYVYDLRCRDDRGTEEFRAHTDVWRRCRDRSDRNVLEQIRDDEVDVLVDTTSHYAGNRLQLFAARPAPVQITFPNYPATTGLDCLDGIVTDRWVCPPEAEAQYSERALRLPSGYLPYEPPACAPAVNALPALKNGYITFGLFQRPVKITPEAWDQVATVLRRTPDSRLLIHNAFRELACAGSFMQQLYARELGHRGISEERLLFRGPVGLTEHLSILAEADIALDTFPYNGQTTTCECLWMGVPVVTLTGAYHVARVGHALLQRAGFPEWETHSWVEYSTVACEVARDLGRLAALRESMRGRMAGSLLLDGAKITAELENTYRRLWERWCFKEEGAHGAFQAN